MQACPIQHGHNILWLECLPHLQARFGIGIPRLHWRPFFTLLIQDSASRTSYSINAGFGSPRARVRTGITQNPATALSQLLERQYGPKTE